MDNRMQNRLSEFWKQNCSDVQKPKQKTVKEMICELSVSDDSLYEFLVSNPECFEAKLNFLVSALSVEEFRRYEFYKLINDDNWDFIRNIVFGMSGYGLHNEVMWRNFKTIIETNFLRFRWFQWVCPGDWNGFLTFPEDFVREIGEKGLEGVFKLESEVVRLESSITYVFEEIELRLKTEDNGEVEIHRLRDSDYILNQSNKKLSQSELKAILLQVLELVTQKYIKQQKKDSE